MTLLSKKEHNNDNCNMCGIPLPYWMRNSISCPSVKVPHPVHPMMTVEKLLCSEKCKGEYIWGIREAKRIYNLRINRLKRWWCRQKKKTRYDEKNHVLYWKQTVIQIVVAMGIVLMIPENWYTILYIANAVVIWVRGFLWVGNVYPKDKYPITWGSECK